MISNRNLYIVSIIISIPFILWAILQILPTFDDWTTLSLPNYDPNYLLYILPFGMTWRPGDAIWGYINAIDYQLYPALNHVMIFIAHICSTLVIYKLTKVLDFKIVARNIATTFFYLSPCVLGTILSCDALNQSYSHLWGILSVFLYIKTVGKQKYIVWTICTYLSVLSKDNGLAWAIIPPIIAYTFHFIDKKTFKKDIGFGLGIAISYAIIRLTIPYTYVKNGSYEEDVVSLHSRIKGLVNWICYTWFAADYIAIVPKTFRNLFLGFLTLSLSCTFMIKIWCNKNIWHQKQIWMLVITLFIVASPHLLISMSIMNTYSSLGIASLIIGYLVNNCKKSNTSIQKLFLCYIIAAIITDVHHWYMAWQTSLPGKTIAEEIVRKTGKPVNKVYCILIRDNMQKFSSFCVPADEAVGWGRAVWAVTGYKWPKLVNDTTIERDTYSQKEIQAIAYKVLQEGYEVVWIVNKEHVEVIKNK